MKKLTLALSVIGSLLFANLDSTAVTPSSATTTTINSDWMKAKDGAWEGKMEGKTYWYKLDKNAKLWWSANKGKDWKMVDNQMWADKDGKWVKISNNDLVWSADMGKTWATVPDWTWQGSDAKWYKFDKDWSVWVK